MLHEALVTRPSCRIRHLGCRIRHLAGTRAREIRFSRFPRHPRVSVSALAAHAATATAERVVGRRVLAIQDTSDLILGGRRARASGYGPVGKGGNLGGLCPHPVLAVDADTGALLGLVDLAIWNREGGQRVTSRGKRAVAEKASQRWLSGAARAAERLSQADRVMGVADRESDIYAAFAARPSQVDLLIRGAQDRRIVHAPGEPDSVAYATWVIARLGGWTGYYGKQGPQVLRRGLDTFRAVKLGAALRPPDA